MASTAGEIRTGRRVEEGDLDFDDEFHYFLDEANEMPLLTHREEVALAKTYEAGRQAQEKLTKKDIPTTELEKLREQVEEGKAARQQLIYSNFGLVMSIARKYTGQGILFRDLAQEGNIGLMKGIDKFDYRRGYRFSTYVTWHIRHEVSRAVDNQSRNIRVPVQISEGIRGLKRIIREFEETKGYMPDVYELAQASGLKVGQVKLLLKNDQPVLSLEVFGVDGTDSRVLKDEETITPGEFVDLNLLRAKLEEMIAFIGKDDPRYVEILDLVFGFHDKEIKIPAVADRLGLSHEWVRQLKKMALDALKDRYGEELLDFLEKDRYLSRREYSFPRLTNLHDSSSLVSPEEIVELEKALEKAWCRETLLPKERADWDETDPSYSQACVTAMVINELLGGEIIQGTIPQEPDNFHFWNILADGSRHDFDRKQFPRGYRFEPVKSRSLESLLEDTETQASQTEARFKLLLERTRRFLPSDWQQKLESRLS